MYRAMKTLGLSVLLATLALAPGVAQSAELPESGDLLERVAGLQESITGLEEAGQINHAQAKALSRKLKKVSKALEGVHMAAPSGDVTAQQAGEVAPQQVGQFLRELRRAINALLDFIGALTELVTDLPSEVVQPIIDAAIQLLQDLIGLLFGALD